MSRLHDGAPDPLTALRSSDRRPRSVVWREQMTSVSLSGVGSLAGRVGVVGLCLALVFGIGWRLFIESQPPVEESIPFATGIADEPALVVGDELSELDVSTPEVNSAGTPIAPAEPTSTDGDVAVGGVEVVVHVAGAVHEPGVVRGFSTWRVNEAVTAAGGPTATADLDRINLAALIADGQRIYVPHVDVDIPQLVEPDTATLPGGDEVGELINLNTAESSRLEELPGVGPATAAAIISHREEHGAFGSVEALVAVSGIGPATLDSLRDHVTI